MRLFSDHVGAVRPFERMRPLECTFPQHPMAHPCSRPPPKGRRTVTNWEEFVFQIWTVSQAAEVSGKSNCIEGRES